VPGLGRSAGAPVAGGGAFAAGLPPAVDRVLASPSGGTPIPPEVRRRVEPHVGTDLGAVRVLTGPRAAVAAASLGARAFTVGSTIALGRGESPHDTRLMAHEAAHVVQQEGAANRSAVHRATIMRDLTDLLPDLPDLPDISVTDLVPQWILDGVTDAVRSIPGYRLLTQVIGTDPLTGAPVEADRQAMLDELLSYGPFGAAVGQALQGMDALGDVVAVVTETLSQYRLTFARLKSDVDAAWDQFSVTNGIDGNVAIVVRVVEGILADVRRFVSDLVERVLAIVREAVLDLVEPLLTEDPTIGPVWSLATKVFHHDPLRGVPVEAETVDILADFLHLTGQDTALDQMRERGTLQETADWLDTQFETFLGLLDQATTLFSDAWAAIQPENLGTLLETLPGLAQRAFALIVGVGSFAGTVLAKVLELVKKSLLDMLSRHAYAIPGFRMVSVIIGRNPFTGEEVARTAENLIGGFITLLPGGEATYQQLSETGVIGEAAARIESAMATLGITPDLVIRTFLGLWDTLSLEDLLAPVDAFQRVVALFGEPIARIFEFVTVVVQVVVELVLRLMNFPTDLLASIMTQTVQAITDIRRDPVGFLLHLLEALKAGFQGFFANALQYLMQGLVSWLFRGLSQLGITIPTEISFASILGLVLEVLGLSMEFVWRKLGEHVGEDRVAMIRENLDRLGQAWAFVQDVQSGGIAAIWGYVADQLSTLWSTILSMASEWIMSTIVTNGMTKLLSFLDPSGIMAVVNSCIAFFNAVQSAIEYVREILEIVNTFVSTLAAVARGDITPGAQMIEGGLAASIPVALGFLAAQLGLGDVPEKIAEIIRSIRDVVEAAIDWLIEQALKLGAAALDALEVRRGTDEVPGTATPAPGRASDVLGVKALALARLEERIIVGSSLDEIRAIVASVYEDLSSQGLKSLTLTPVGDGDALSVMAEASPATNLLTLIPKVSESSAAVVRTFVRLTLAAGESVLAMRTVEIPAEPTDDTITAHIANTHGLSAIAKTAPGASDLWQDTKRQLTTMIEVEVPGGAGAGMDPTMKVRRARGRHVDDAGKRVNPGEGFFIEGKEYYLVRAAEPERRGATHTGAVLMDGGTDRLDAIFWSRGSGDPSNARSHAETAFMNWFRSLDESIRARVRHIQLQNDPYSPCWTCAGNLVGFLRPLFAKGITGELSWSEAYERAEEGGGRAGGWSTKSSLDSLKELWQGPYGPYPTLNVGYEKRRMGS
jgi:hypothetical protein